MKTILFALIVMLAFSCKKETIEKETTEKNTDSVPKQIIAAKAEIFNIYSVSKNSATVKFNITGSEISKKGICWSTSKEPTKDDANLIIDSNDSIASISGLISGATYNIKAFATNRAGTSYSSNKILVTLPAVVKDQTISDIDGNKYHTVAIGEQEWMAENLKTTRLNNGDSIKYVTDNWKWSVEDNAAYCYNNNYNNNNKDIYGSIYNFYTVSTSKLCPIGWHVPSESDWVKLIKYLGDDRYAAGKIKETTTTHWSETNEGVTNETGFTALPGGHRQYDGSYSNTGSSVDFWSSKIVESKYGGFRSVSGDKIFGEGSAMPINSGLYVRCIKD